MKKIHKLLVITVVIVLGLLVVIFVKSRSISVYTTKKNCELATNEECVFPVCGHIPKGADFKEVCNVDFNQGWITTSDFALYADRLSTVFSSKEICELSAKKTCTFKDCSLEMYDETCGGDYQKGWRSNL